MTCPLTIPARFLGGAKRIAFAVNPGDAYYCGSDSYPVQLWIALSGSTTHRISSFSYPSHAPGDWAEGVVFDQDASGSGHISGTVQWAKLAAEEFTTITLVMTKRAGQAVAAPVLVGPIYTDPVHPATLTLFMDGQYEGQHKYARQILQAYGLQASLAVLPYWLNDYPSVGAGAFPDSMSLSKLLAMRDAGHELIAHTGTGGPAGNINVGWDNTAKYPDGQVYDLVRADQSAAYAWLRSVGAESGAGYGVVSFTNGLAATQSLSRRADIARALRDAGTKRIRATGSYLASFYGACGESSLITTQSKIVTSADDATSINNIVTQLEARGGWTGLVFHNFVLSGATGNSVNVDVFRSIVANIASRVAAGTLRVRLFSVAMSELSAMRAPV